MKITIKAESMVLFLGAGIGWFALGVLRLIRPNAEGGILQYGLLFIAAISTAVIWLPKKDFVDEMARNHLTEASAAALVVLLIAIVCLGIVNILFYEITYRQVYPLLIGLAELTIGLRFLKLERDG